ncbi:MAG: deoxyribose-phosphate aldolase [Neisseriaceae bacterium]
MIELQKRTQKILQLIDLTSLNDNDTNLNIESLCNKATTRFGNVAAICIYSRFISFAKQILKNSNIKIATVTNFPHGSSDIEIALFETQLALERGADEVDIVFPYHELINGNNRVGIEMIQKAKKACNNKILKVIIESGELDNPELIKLASEISIDNGADFIKTSTGKVTFNATLTATEIMLNTIKASNKNCGFKAAGGIKTISEAIKYIELAEQIMGSDWINSYNFRFGASGLLTDVLRILENKPSDNIEEANY